MTNSEPLWHEQIADDDVALTLKYNQWCEIAGSLQQLIIDRSRDDYVTLNRNKEYPVDSEQLLTLARQIEQVLLTYRDTNVPQWEEISK